MHVETGAGEGETLAHPEQDAGGRARFVALLPSLLAIVLIGVAFGLTVWRTRSLEMGIRPPMWVVNAIPPALSELYFNHPYRYTVLTSVRDRFYDNERLPERTATAEMINAAIKRVSQIRPGRAGGPYTLMGPDDKGIVDLTRMSFQIFGYQAESIIKLYYAILLISCVLYVLAFWRSPGALLLLAAFLGMLYLSLPMVAYNGQLRSVLALRAAPVLSMVACLHCLLFMAGSLRGRVTFVQICLVALQIALIAFTMHLRTTTLWQIMTIVGFGAVILLIASVRRWGLATAPWRTTALAVGTTVTFAILGYYGLQAYQAAYLPEEYKRGEQIGTRVFWHNIFSGLTYHPVFAERYRLRIDDGSVFLATREYLTETGRYHVWQEMGGEVPDLQGINFTMYDPLAREMLFARCTTYVRECAEAIFYYKPIALLGNLAWLYGVRNLPPNLDIFVPQKEGEGIDEVKQQFIRATLQMDEKGQRAYLWTPAVLLIILPFAWLLARPSRQSTWVPSAAAVGLMAGSLIPTVIGYPAPHTILEGVIAVGILTYFGLCLALAIWLPSLVPASWPGRRREASSPLTPAAH